MTILATLISQTYSKVSLLVRLADLIFILVHQTRCLCSKTVLLQTTGWSVPGNATGSEVPESLLQHLPVAFAKARGRLVCQHAEGKATTTSSILRGQAPPDWMCCQRLHPHPKV